MFTLATNMSTHVADHATWPPQENADWHDQATPKHKVLQSRKKPPWTHTLWPLWINLVSKGLETRDIHAKTEGGTTQASELMELCKCISPCIGHHKAQRAKRAPGGSAEGEIPASAQHVVPFPPSFWRRSWPSLLGEREIGRSVSRYFCDFWDKA